MQLNIYEVLDLLEKTKTAKEAEEVLRKNTTKALASVLYHTFNFDIEFYRTDAPKGYKPSHDGPGLSFSNLHEKHPKFYLFYKHTPLVLKRKDELLLMHLESLEAREAEVMLNMFGHDLKCRALNLPLIKKVFPNLLK